MEYDFFNEFHELCRACANKQLVLQSMFDVTVYNKTIAEMIFICTQTTVLKDDLRPSGICRDCEIKLNAAYEFVIQVKDAEMKFQKMLTSREINKTESFDETNIIENELLAVQSVIPEYDLDIKLEVESVSIEEPEMTVDSLEENKIKTSINREAIKRKPRRQLKNENQLINHEYECYKCKKNIKSMCKLKVHMRREHESNRRCMICLQCFSFAQYEKHLCQGKQIQCEFCTDKFTRTFRYTKHLKSHTKRKPFECSKCNTKLTTKTLLEWHESFHSANDIMKKGNLIVKWYIYSFSFSYESCYLFPCSVYL